MILEFKIKNYRSYMDEVVFSLQADASKQKKQNISELNLPNEQNTRILKTAILFGPNASGKTNVIRALFYLIYYILNKPKVGSKVLLGNPHKFDLSTASQPSEFTLTFIGPSSYKYIYTVKLTNNEIHEEELNYYPTSRPTNLFKREPYNPEKTIQIGKLGASKNHREISVFKNQLVLSKFGDDEPDELLSEVFLYFKKYFIMNAGSSMHKDELKATASKNIYNNKLLQKKVQRLISEADTKINGLFLTEDEKSEGAIIVYAEHDVYSNDEIIGKFRLNMRNESQGTNTLYLLGGKIIDALDQGGILIIDELDTSLHPYITKLIVMMFQSEKHNQKGAQLIFTTHDVTLLNRDLIRKDQIWFTEKNEKGISDLYSLQDFDGLREDTPFEKWYLAGKFGGLPNIKSVDSIFEGIDED